MNNHIVQRSSLRQEPTTVCHGFRLTKQDDIFQSILTTFESSVTFRGNWGSTGNLLDPKTKPPLQILTKLSLSKSVIHTRPYFTGHIYMRFFLWVIKVDLHQFCLRRNGFLWILHFRDVADRIVCPSRRERRRWKSGLRSQRSDPAVKKKWFYITKNHHLEQWFSTGVSRHTRVP